MLVELAHNDEVPTSRTLRAEPETRDNLAWLDERTIQRIEDPAERFTMSFLQQLVGQDRRRVERQLGIATFFDQYRYSVPVHGLETHLDHREREDQALLLSERQGLLNRPLRRALRKSTFIRDFSVVIDNFKADNVPLTSPYEENHRRGHYGRVSVRLRPTRTENPFEVRYRLQGWNIGTGIAFLRAGYETQLSDQVFVSVRTRYTYEESSLDLWGNLHYELDQNTQLHVLVGNQMDIVGGSTMSPVVRSPVVLRAVDQSPGFMFYVEHLF